ncbi:MAG: hypothetical protein K8R36_02925 [Planctomycetales bacterium]|nr:hypothetical protein [Planctomycetales bacterium]
MQTPEFLVWSLERRCELRQIAGFEDPERTERHLRTLRAYSEAVEEGRVFEGICVAPPNGFQVEDAISLYGGLSPAEAACRECPANAGLKENRQSLAGCFGMVGLPPDEAEVHTAVEEAIGRLNLWTDVEASFQATKPAWYGLWMQSPLNAPRSRLLQLILQSAGGREGSYLTAIRQMILGLEAAVQHNLPLHVRLYPRGEVQGVWWNLVPHCQNCHAPWLESNRDQCQVCGYVGRPASPPKRRARGTRPYWPLERMMGKEKAAEFLVRYEAQQRIERSKQD